MIHDGDSIFLLLQSVYLVGGFAANPYLVARLRDSLTPSGVSVTTPDGQTYKHPFIFHKV